MSPQYATYYTAELGLRTFRHFNELVRIIKRIVEKDEIIRQKIINLSKSNKIYLVPDVMYSWRDEAVEIKNNAIYINADPGYFGGYLSVGYGIIDLVKDYDIVPSFNIKMDTAIPSPATTALIERKKQNDLCEECGQSFSSCHQWCQFCNACRFQEAFQNWTSGNREIDAFIQHTQLTALDANNVIEWIPYSRFADITPIGKGGYGTIEMAYWLDGDIRRWDHARNEWERHPGFAVVLKTLNNSQSLSVEFLNEVRIISDLL